MHSPAPLARVIDTAPLHLDQIIAEMETAHAAGQDVARVHSGDPSIYGAIAEQMRRLDALGIAYDVTPGVPAFAAAAAMLKSELTFARGQPDHHPDPHRRRSLADAGGREPGGARPFAGDRWRSISRCATSTRWSRNLSRITARIARSWWSIASAGPDQHTIRGTLADIKGKVMETKITRTALILVGRVFENASASVTAGSMPPTTSTCCPAQAQSPGALRGRG